MYAIENMHADIYQLFYDIYFCSICQFHFEGFFFFGVFVFTLILIGWFLDLSHFFSHKVLFLLA